MTIIWVTFHIINSRNIAKVDDNNWTFGQILPVVLLVLPLLTMLEFFVPEKINDTGTPAPPNAAEEDQSWLRVTTSPQRISGTMSLQDSGAALDNIAPRNPYNHQPDNDAATTVHNRQQFLDRDYYNDTPWIAPTIFIACVQITVFTGMVLYTYYQSLAHSQRDIGPFEWLSVRTTPELSWLSDRLLAWTILIQPMALWLSIYIGLVTEDYLKWLRRPSRRALFWITAILIIMVFTLSPF